jgi:hypothetical protein
MNGHHKTKILTSSTTLLILKRLKEVSSLINLRAKTHLKKEKRMKHFSCHRPDFNVLPVLVQTN